MRQFVDSNRLAFMLAVLLLSLLLPAGPVVAGSANINCLAHDGACSLPLGGSTVTLEITPRPVTAMQDSFFTVTLSGNAPEQAPYIELGMPAMKMGPNRVVLKPSVNGEYTGKGVIVRCKSGRRTWFANVIVPGAGETRFVFDVVY